MISPYVWEFRRETGLQFHGPPKKSLQVDFFGNHYFFGGACALSFVRMYVFVYSNKNQIQSRKKK